jgi:hypothetical protein
MAEALGPFMQPYLPVSPGNCDSGVRYPLAAAVVHCSVASAGSGVRAWLFGSHSNQPT